MKNSNNTYEIIGGARIGSIQGSWPFGRLSVSADRLEVSVSIRKVVFAPEDIVAIEPYFIIPLIGQGIRVVHSVDNYSKKVIFFGFSSPGNMISNIKKTGFLDSRNTSLSRKKEEIIVAQSQGGASFKKAAIIVGVIAWNLPIIWGVFPALENGGKYGPRFYHGVLVSLGLLLSASIGIVTLERFRELLLQPGYDKKGVAKIGWFMVALSGVMFLSFFLLYCSV